MAATGASEGPSQGRGGQVFREQGAPQRGSELRDQAARDSAIRASAAGSRGVGLRALCLVAWPPGLWTRLAPWGLLPRDEAAAVATPCPLPGMLQSDLTLGTGRAVPLCRQTPVLCCRALLAPRWPLSGTPRWSGVIQFHNSVLGPFTPTCGHTERGLTLLIRSVDTGGPAAGTWQPWVGHTLRV